MASALSAAKQHALAGKLPAHGGARGEAPWIGGGMDALRDWVRGRRKRRGGETLSVRLLISRD